MRFLSLFSLYIIDIHVYTISVEFSEVHQEMTTLLIHFKCKCLTIKGKEQQILFNKKWSCLYVALSK